MKSEPDPQNLHAVRSVIFGMAGSKKLTVERLRLCLRIFDLGMVVTSHRSLLALVPESGSARGLARARRGQVSL